MKEKERLLSIFNDILSSSSSIKNHIDKIYQIRKDLEDIATDEEKLIVGLKIKSKVQEEVYINFLKSSSTRFGAFYGATGVGKSKIAISIGSRIALDIIYKEPNFLLVVPTEKLRDENWKDEFYKWGESDLYDKQLERCCYASLSKYAGRTFDYVILDEGHNITEANSVFFNNNVVKSCILLSATKPRDTIKLDILKKLKLDTFYELSLMEAIKLGLVPEFDITIVTLQLDDKDKYIKAGNKKSPFMTTEKANYSYLTKKCMLVPNKFNFISRTRFIYNLKSKTEAAEYLLDNVIPKEYRTIIFCGSINQANTVCPDRFHSDTDDLALAAFKISVINKISCVNALNEGHNIDNLDCALVIQLNSNEKNLIQRIGRIRYRPDHIAHVIILCVSGTVDNNWVIAATKNMIGINIKSVTLKELQEGTETIIFN